MHELSYKVSAAGAISAFRGSERLCAPWLEVKLQPGPHRAALRKQLDRQLVYAAGLIFGRRMLPADINELALKKRLVKQVLADAPRLLPLVYEMVTQQRISATPLATVVFRTKLMLMKKGYRQPERVGNGGIRMRPMSSLNPVERFWESYADDEGLTDAGWRYLARHNARGLRAICASPWRLRTRAAVLNTLAQLEYPTLGSDTLLEFGERVNHALSATSYRHLLAAMRSTLSLPTGELYRQCDVVKEWIVDARPEIQAKTLWSSLVQRAAAYAVNQVPLNATEMSKFVWTPPIAPFVTPEALVVTPLSNGAEVIEEGVQMQNCLDSTRRYVEEATRGLSQIFRIEGVAGRATAEFTRRTMDAPWTLSQAEEADNVKTMNPAVLAAVKLIGNQLGAQ